MLNKQMQPERFQNAQMFRVVDRVCQNDFDALCAEYIVLGKTKSITAETLKIALDSSKVFQYSVLEANLNGIFFCDGKFKNTDTELASKKLFENLTFWLRHNKNSQLLEKNIALLYERYFSKISSTALFLGVSNLLPKQYVIDNSKLRCEQQLLSKIMCGELKAGDDVTHILCPLKVNSNIDYVINMECFLPFFKNLIKIQGNSLILVIESIHNEDFIMAFFESLTFKILEHKQEVLEKIKTILLSRN